MIRYNKPPGSRPPWRAQGWTRIALVLIVLAVGGYLSWQQRQNERQPPRPANSPRSVPREPADAAEGGDQEIANPQQSPIDSPTTTGARRATISDQTIRDLEGGVAFRGEIDVGPTLERIQAGKRLDFPNDGATFQNREGRLPRKPAGYYKEYVHPTPGIRGPGPQRIVAGENGEFYYTPDHYRTFRRVDQP
jgi:ribonuclease T1